MIQILYFLIAYLLSFLEGTPFFGGKGTLTGKPQFFGSPEKDEPPIWGTPLTAL